MVETVLARNKALNHIKSLLFVVRYSYRNWLLKEKAIPTLWEVGRIKSRFRECDKNDDNECYPGGEEVPWKVLIILRLVYRTHYGQRNPRMWVRKRGLFSVIMFGQYFILIMVYRKESNVVRHLVVSYVFRGKPNAPSFSNKI